VTIHLSDEQSRAIDKVRDWYQGAPRTLTPFGNWTCEAEPFRLFGPAGTGKTTLAKHLGAALGVEPMFGAYTGKAASVLRKKGVPATTIHSAIYTPAGDDDDGTTAFVFNPMGPWRDADLIVLDEVSMVDQQMAADIESYGVPVLVLGDPAQLPPVRGEGYYTSTTPDVLLDTIHRQALESPVLELATRVRLSQGRKLGIRRDEVGTASITAMMDADQVLCWRNATRWKAITAMRARRGAAMGEVMPGDRIICLTNNRDIGVLNGMQFDVDDVDTFDGFLQLKVRETGAKYSRWLHVYADGFNGPTGEAQLKQRRAWRGQLAAATYADAITVHKSQGSEWEHVYVIDETPAMEDRELARRWLYTAVSRASESVTLARLK
jgi:exodeoxyribonuclease-5